MQLLPLVIGVSIFVFACTPTKSQQKSYRGTIERAGAQDQTVGVDQATNSENQPQDSTLSKDKEAAVNKSQTPLAPELCLSPADSFTGLAAPSDLQAPSFEFFEGPVWFPSEQKLLASAWNFSDSTDGKGPPSTILAWQNGVWSEYAPKGVIRSNGLTLNTKGQLTAALHDNREIAVINSNLQRTALVSTVNGVPFHSPNDLIFHKSGTLFFTDPDYQNDNRAPKPASTALYSFLGGTIKLIYDASPNPNGLTLSPDGNTLYLGAADGKILKFAVSANGLTTAEGLFFQAESGVDGMTSDCAGNIYAAIHSRQEILVLSPSAQVLARISIGVNVTNLEFGGPDLKSLFVTTAGKVFTLKMKIAGLRSTF